jgi:hypothetical protein
MFDDFDTTLLINRLKELQKQETESLYGRIREIENKFDNMIRNIYDDELRTFFYFPITDAISEEYNELLDDYIDMMELRIDALNINEMDLMIHNFGEKHTPN